MNINHCLVTLLVLLCFSEMGLKAQTVQRGPYLQMSTPTSTIIRWRTDISTQSKVWYGTSANNLSQMASTSGTTKNHEVLVDGLLSATKYYYKIGDNNGPYNELHGTQYFKTHPSGDVTSEPIRAWMLGNAGTKMDDQLEVRDAYYAVINDEHIDMILLTGDNAYDDGEDSEYQEAIFEDMYEARLVNSVMWSCFGNHDAGDADSEDESGTYYDIFNFPRNGEAGGVPSGTEAYYSFDYGNMHVISLNTVDVDREPGGDMINWLEADLAANQKKWQVVMLHHRPYTGSNDNDSDDDEKPTDVREYFLPRLEAAGVDLVLSSHSHNYQRSFLINGHYGKSNTFDEDIMGVDMGDGQPDGDGAYSKVNSDIGTVYVVAGTAGQDDSGADELNHPVMYYNSGSAGSVQLLVSDAELVFQFINEDEEIEDYFTIEKTPSIPDSGFKITNPTDGAAFASQQNITITADTTGSLFTVDYVDFYVDNNLIGTVNAYPFYQSWTVPGAGEFEIKAIAHEQLGNGISQSIVHITSGSSQICAKISASNNDAEEKNSGSVSLTSKDLELAEDGSTQQIGLRFQEVGLPAGVLIDSAFIQFRVDETDNINPCLLNIYGEKSTNPASYEDETNNISNRLKTNAQVSWAPENWDAVGDSGDAQRTPDIALILRELIGQASYNNENALAFIINGTGKRVAESFNGGAEKAPELCIYYSPALCDDIDNDGICDDNDPCPGGPEFGLACDDGNPDTTDDTVDENCNCVGTPVDCPGIPGGIGAPCDDNNAGTYDDVIIADCSCVGTFYGCPLLQAEIGTPCDDNNTGTYDDIVTADCECLGTLYGCPTLQAEIGSPCDDNNVTTYNDVVTPDCECAGTLYDCPIILLNFGAPCFDNNPTTYDDVVISDCDCAGTPYDCPLLLGNIGAPCDDGNPNTNDEVIDVDCNCTGSLYDCPALSVNIGDACDDGNALTVNDVVTEGCACAGILLQEEVVVVPVSSQSDDAEEDGEGFLSLTSSDLELTFDDDNQTIGIRFTNTGIPAGAIISDAYIQFTADETKFINPCLLTITGEAADQSLTFIKEQYDISSRPRTNNAVSWQPPLWDDVGDNGLAQQTSNLTTVVQELVNRPGYNMSSPMTFIIEGTGKRVADSYDGDPDKAPKLHVTFVFYCEDADNDGVCNGQDLCANSPEPGTPCNDNNVATYDDVIDGNCNCNGTPFDCPVLLANFGDSCDDGDPLTINDALDGNCLCVGVIPGTEQTVCSQIATANDDVEERADGSMKMNSGDIELVVDANSQMVGLRFLNLNIPQGAVIQEAAIQFMVDETSNLNPSAIFIYAEAVDNAGPFSDADLNISNRTRTNAVVRWSPPLWTVKGNAGDNERTFDMSSVLQEVVSRPGFSENSAVVIMMDGSGRRVAEAYEGGADRAAKLCVTYSMTIPPSSNVVTVNQEDVILQPNETTTPEGSEKGEEEAVLVTFTSLKVYPNPTKDQLNLAYYSTAETETQIQIQNVNGQLLSVQTFKSTKGNNQIRIANLELPNGVYIVRMQEGREWLSRKFVVLK